MIKQPIVALLIILLNFSNLVANNIVDSLCKELEEIPDEQQKLDRYFYFVSEIQIHDPNAAYEKATDYLQLASKLNNEFHIGLAHYRLGSIMHLQTKFANSMKELVAAQTIFEKLNHKKYIAETDIEIAALYKITGNYKESEARLKKGIDYIRTSENKARLGDLYFNLGNLKTFTGDYDSALFYMEKAGDYFSRSDDSIGMSRLNLSLGYLLQTKGELKPALEHAKKSLASSQTLEDLICNQASLTLIGAIFKDLNLLDSSEYYLLEAYSLDSIVQNSDMTADVSKQLSDVYELKGQHELSNHYLNEYLALHEDLYNPVNMGKLTEIIRKFELQKKENELLEKEIEAARKKRYLILSIVLILACIIIISVLVIRSKKSKRDQQKKIKLYESEQAILNEILERRNRELVANTLNLTKKEQILKTVNRELAIIKAELAEKGIGDGKLRRVMREIRPEVARKSQNLFEKQFIDTHPKFYERIMERSETLTPNERKLCAFLRLNMTTKEIAELTEQSPRAVEVARHRLRKKLKLKRSENLTSFLANLSTE